MSSYVVLARKWRPAQFSDIVGQSHIVRTLGNAIRGERIHQAYLFTGSRGIGKTSIARIFAKVIRCENAKVDQTSGWLISCDECHSCKEITSGTSVDVIEIDGASNNGVDSVREIRDNAKFMPATGKRKIYIIDEVHMLSTAAFNALLKTLEEPPEHVIFVLATTEPHKIPATILSRCQRFDFRRVTVAQIQTRLEEVTKAEKIQSEAGTLTLIARAAEGSMRDALSLLDQVIAFSGDRLSTQSVRESIGLIESETLLHILDGIFSRKPLDAIHHVDQAYQRGHDLRVLTRSLIEFLHGALLAKAGASHSSLLEFSEEEWKEISSIAQKRSLEEIEMIFQALHYGLDWIARSPQPKIVLDVLLVKCATAEQLVYADGSSRGAPAQSSGSAKPVTASVQNVLKTASAPSLSQPVAPTASAPTAPATRPVAAGPRSWEGLIEHVRKLRPLLASVLEHGSCPDFSPETTTLTVCFGPKEAYYREQLQARVYVEQMNTFSKEYFGHPVHMRVEVRETGESLADKKERELKERQVRARDAAQNHPIIKEARSLFGGELGPIELTESGEEDHG